MSSVHRERTVLSTPIELRHDLRHAGVEVDGLWALVNYLRTVPVLLDWLTHIEYRVPEDQRQKVREGLVRSLKTPQKFIRSWTL